MSNETLRTILEKSAGRGDQPAIIALQREGSISLSHAELARQARRLAGGLLQAGIEPGDRVVLLAGTRPEWLVACLAIIAAGAVAVPLDVQLADETLIHVLTDAEPRAIFTTGEHVARLEEMDIDVPQLFLFDAEQDDERHWQRLQADAGELPELAPDEPAILFYTSGTTGKPKGVPLSHTNLLFQIHAVDGLRLVQSSDRLLQPLPPHHVYPLVIGMLTPLALGVPIVLPAALTGPQIIRALREGEITIVIGVPRLYAALYEGIQGRLRNQGRIVAGAITRVIGVSSWLRQRTGLRIGHLVLRPLHRRVAPNLRMLASGGAPLDPDLAHRLEGLGWQVSIGYGLTETSPLLTAHMPGAGHLETVGNPLEGVEIRIDPDAVPEEARGAHKTEQGEIMARGPTVFAGYHNLPDKTAEDLTEDGWFRTGDMGYLDRHNFLHITGRVSTLIVTSGGENIQPDEVEAAYEASPLVREVGVLQQDDQLVGLFVPDMRAVRERDADAHELIRGVVDEVSRDLPSYQRIADFAITHEQLPRTRLGKIRRHLLPERYERARVAAEHPESVPSGPIAEHEMAAEDRTLLQNPAARSTWEWLADRYREQRLTPDTSLQFDLGVDSLEWLSLTMEIGQRAGVELTDDEIAQIDTVHDLLQAVAEQVESGKGQSPTYPLEHPEEAISAEQETWLAPKNRLQRSLARVLYGLNWGVLRLFFRLRVEGLEHTPREGQLVFAPNHVSYLDPPALAAALRYSRLQRAYWAGSAQVMFRNPLLRLVSRVAQVVPLDHRRAVMSSLAFGAVVLHRGHDLVWFPEGRRSESGELQEFRPGIGMLLEHYRTPVVPVFISGSAKALPPGRFWPRFRPVTVCFGAPVEVDDLEEEGTGDEPHLRIAQALHDRVAALASGGKPALQEREVGS